MADKFWWRDSPALKAREEKERSATREATKALDKAYADSRKGKKMSDRKIVGWFYRNGKRIPIFEKSGNSKGDLRSGKARRAQDEARSNTVKTIARIDAGLASDGTVMDKAKARDKRDHLEESLKSDFYKKREPADRDELRRNVKIRDRKSRNEILDISDSDAKVAEAAGFEVATPRESANALGKRVRTSDGKIIRPVKRTGIDIETRVNNDIGENPEHYISSLEELSRTPGQKAYKMRKRLSENRGSAKGKNLREEARRYQASGKLGRDLKKSLDNIPKYGKTQTYEATVTGIKKKGSARGKNLREEVMKKRKDSYGLPQQRSLANKRPAESYIKSVMELRGLNRADAIKYIMEQRKK